MNNRIRELRKTLNLSQKVFAEKIGLKQNAISYMEKNGSTVTEQNIKTICSQFNVNENWLRTGNGNMFLENNKKQKEFFDIFDELSPILQNYLIKTAKNLLDTQAEMQDSINLITSDNFKNTIYNPATLVPDTPEELEALYPPIDINDPSKFDAG